MEIKGSPYNDHSINEEIQNSYFTNLKKEFQEFEEPVRNEEFIDSMDQFPDNLEDAHSKIFELQNQLYSLISKSNHDEEIINSSKRYIQIKEQELYQNKEEHSASCRKYAETLNSHEKLEIDYKNSFSQLSNLFEKVQYHCKMKEQLTFKLENYKTAAKDKLRDLLRSIIDIIKNVCIKWDHDELKKIIIQSFKNLKTTEILKNHFITIIDQQLALEKNKEKNSRISETQSNLFLEDTRNFHENSNCDTTNPKLGLQSSSPFLSFQSTIDSYNYREPRDGEGPFTTSRKPSKLNDERLYPVLPSSTQRSQKFEDNSSQHSLNGIEDVFSDDLETSDAFSKTFYYSIDKNQLNKISSHINHWEPRKSQDIFLSVLPTSTTKSNTSLENGKNENHCKDKKPIIHDKSNTFLTNSKIPKSVDKIYISPNHFKPKDKSITRSFSPEIILKSKIQTKSTLPSSTWDTLNIKSTCLHHDPSTFFISNNLPVFFNSASISKWTNNLNPKSTNFNILSHRSMQQDLITNSNIRQFSNDYYCYNLTLPKQSLIFPVLTSKHHRSHGRI